MIENSFPTRGEANDIFNSLEMGANGLVLAAETAIGKNPISTVKFLNKMIKAFKNSQYKNLDIFNESDSSRYRRQGGSDFFQGLLDNHNEILQIPGILRINKEFRNF